MSKYEKLLFKLLSGKNDTNFAFSDLCKLLDELGFDRRIKGSHDIYYKNNVDEIINK